MGAGPRLRAMDPPKWFAPGNGGPGGLARPRLPTDPINHANTGIERHRACPRDGRGGGQGAASNSPTSGELGSVQRAGVVESGPHPLTGGGVLVGRCGTADRVCGKARSSICDQ